MFAVIFDLEGQLDCTLHTTADAANQEAARLSQKYAAERANYSASVAVQTVNLPPLYAEAPAMLAALRKFTSDNRADNDGNTVAFLVPVADYEAARAILARIDGAPTAQPAGDDPAITAAANLSRAGLVKAAGEALALQDPISEAGDHCASCGAEEGESHGAQCETRGFAVGVDARRLDTGALRTVAGDDAAWLEATAGRDGGEF